MNSMFKKLMCQPDEAVMKDNEALFEMQTIHEEQTNLLIVSEDGESRFDTELKPGEFTIINNELSGDTYFCKTIEEAIVINKAVGASVFVYYDVSNLAAVVNSVYEFGYHGNSIIISERDFSASEMTIVEELTSSLSLVTSYRHSDYNNYAEMVCELGYSKVCSDIQIQKDKAPKKRRIKFKRVTDLGPLMGVDWLIHETLQAKGFANIFGPSGHCKSFVALDMACCIALGRDWHGRPTMKSSVLYICGEGQDGINARIMAWCAANNYKGELNVFMTDEPLHLLNEGRKEEYIETVKELEEEVGMKFDVTFVDTLNRNFGDGDENSTRDMTLFTQSCIDIQRELDTSVIVVHHTSNANPRMARGSSSLRSSLESEINVLKPENDNKEQYGYVECNVTKQKNGPDISPMFFLTETVNLGLDMKGREVSSLAMKSGTHVDSFVKECLEGDAEPKKKPLKSQSKVSTKNEADSFSGIPQYAVGVLQRIRDHGGYMSKNHISAFLMSEASYKNCANDIVKYLLSKKMARIDKEHGLHAL